MQDASYFSSFKRPYFYWELNARLLIQLAQIIYKGYCK